MSMYEMWPDNLPFSNPFLQIWKKSFQVVGVPDQRKGEEICAWVQLANPNAKVTEEELRQFCKERVIRKKKINSR